MSSSLYGPAGASIPIPTGPAPDYKKLIENDPFYLQQKEWMREDAELQKQRLAADRAMAEKFYNLNVQQASASGNSGGDYGLASAQAQAELQKQVAARENAQKEEYIREAMASRGMYDSGQRPLEQANREFDYTTMLKGIDLDLQARASAAAASRASQQQALALQLQEMQLRYQAQQQGYLDAEFDINRGLKRGEGETAMQTYERLWKTGALEAPSVMAQWDPASGLYRTGDGRYFDAAGNPASPASSPTPSGGGGGAMVAYDVYAPPEYTNNPIYNTVGINAYGI